MTLNQQWRLARQPIEGWPTDGDFVLDSAETPAPGANQALTRTLYLSLDPYQWGRRRSGIEQIGDVCHGRTVSQVLKSRLSGYQEGDIIFNTNGWQEYGLVGQDISEFGYMHPRVLDTSQAPASSALGVLGMLGLTAYSGLYVQCQPRSGETVVVSAASGGVGQNVVQIAKLKGCHVVGIVGTDDKCDFVVDSLGAEACINRKSPGFVEQLQRACPDGVDIYFENVGGEVFEAVLPLLNKSSRISLCGLISQYGHDDAASNHARWQETGAPFFATQQVQVNGLFVGNFVDDYQRQFLEEMGDWVRNGRVKYKEDIWRGIEKAPEAFDAMLKGENFGKTIVQVSTDSVDTSYRNIQF
ncbi:NADP-dependent oxidoreductase [Gammaproteobacteria bacterium]|nr:NADP-dependent oxidoreductase [Gammaproteobacteria bacterium]